MLNVCRPHVLLRIAAIWFGLASFGLLLGACDDFPMVSIRNDLERPIAANFTELQSPGQEIKEPTLPAKRIVPGAERGPLTMGRRTSDVYFFVRWVDTGELVGCVHVDLNRYETSDKITVLASSAEPCPEGSTR